MEEIETVIEGPFGWIGADSVFISRIAARKGVYLFTAQTPKGHLVYYVGETGATFIERLAQHLQSYVIGQYHIYEAQSFSGGVKNLVFEGWMNKKPRRQARAEYLNAIEEYGPKMLEFIGCMKILLLPAEQETRTIERMEAGISLHLKRKPVPVGTFQDEGILYRPRKKSEEPLALRIGRFENILGLNECVEI